MESVKYSFLNNWFDDYVIKSAFEHHIDSFLKYFDDDIRQIILKLLDNYTYINESKMNLLNKHYLASLSSFIDNNSFNNYVITPLIIDNRSHNSFSFLAIFKNNPHFMARLDSKRYSSFSQVFFVDDYSGTGESLKQFDDSICISNDEKSSLYYVPSVITNISIDRIDSDPSLCKYSINKSISREKQAKFLTDYHILTNDEVKKYEDFCIDVLEMDKEVIFGFNNAEELLSFPYFTPNSTLGIFWYDSNPLFVPLFSRGGNQVENIKRDRLFSYKTIKGIRECIRTNASKNMRRYIFIAVLFMITEDKKALSNYLGYSEYDIKNGIRYLKGQNILRFDDSVDLTILNKYIEVDKIVVFVNSGIIPRYKNTNDILANLFKAKHN